MSPASDAVERTEEGDRLVGTDPGGSCCERQERTEFTMALSGSGNFFDSGDEWGAWVGGDFACRERENLRKASFRGKTVLPF